MVGISSSAKDMARAVLDGNRRALSQAITLIESEKSEHRSRAQEMLETVQENCHKRSTNSLRLGLSGVPGVGKSTFIEALGERLIEQGHRCAVLAIDPSSVTQKAGGAILADKTRMPKLAVNENAYIRPSPSRANLGGVARRTREAILLCEAAGFDRIIIETVGVGQSEVSVADMCDIFLLLLLPKSGDEFQALKRGIMQMADIIVVNKSDGDSRTQAMQTAAEYRSAGRLMMPRLQGWQVPVINASALQGDGLEAVGDAINDAHRHLLDSDLLQTNRRQQNVLWMWDDVRNLMLDRINDNPEVNKIITTLQEKVASGTLLPTKAAQDIIKKLGL